MRYLLTLLTVLLLASPSFARQFDEYPNDVPTAQDDEFIFWDASSGTVKNVTRAVMDTIYALAGTTVSVTGASVDGSGHLIINLSDDTTIAAGSVVGPAGAEGPAGEAGPAGSDGAAGPAGAGALIAVTSESAGANCTEGGQKIDFGQDDDADLVLDPLEVDGTAYVCNGTGEGGAVSFNAITGQPTDNTNLAAALAAKEPAFTKNSAFNKNFGTSAGTVLQGNDPSTTNARAPTAHKTTHATGGSDAITAADIDAEPEFTKNTAFNKNFGTGSSDVTRGNDSRLSDTRDPKPHAASHATGQADAISPAAIGALATTHTTTYDHTRIPSADQSAAISGAALPSALNPFATMDDVAGAGIDWTQDQGATNIHAGNIPALNYEPANANIQSHISVTGNPHSATPGDIGAATAAQGALADTAIQPGTVEEKTVTSAGGGEGNDILRLSYIFQGQEASPFTYAGSAIHVRAKENGTEPSGTIHGVSSHARIQTGTNASRELTALFTDTSTDVPGRLWGGDRNTFGPSAAQANLILGDSVFVGNYNAAAITNGGYGVVVTTKPGAGGGDVAATRASAQSYKLDAGLSVVGWAGSNTTTPDGVGWEKGIQVGGYAGGWMDNTMYSLINTGIDITDYKNYGIYLHDIRAGGTPGVAIQVDADAGGVVIDFSLEIPNSTTLPATCTVGQTYMDTDATSGQRFYLCESTNTWALQGDGGAGGLTIREEDGNPTGTPGTLKVTNGTLTNNGDGSFSLNVGGTGSGDNISVDGGAVVDPNFASTGHVDFVNASNTITGNLNNTAVTPGSYTSTNLTVDAQGRITAAASGSSTPAGNAGNVQYNATGALGGSDLFTFSPATGSAVVNLSGDAPTLTLTSNNSATQIFLGASSDTQSAAGWLNFKRSRGTASSPTAVQSGDFLGNINMAGAYAAGSYDSARTAMQLIATENWSATNMGFKWDFKSRDNGTAAGTTVRFTIEHNGDITISDLAGTYGSSSAYVCVNNSGTLFSSESACP